MLKLNMGLRLGRAGFASCGIGSVHETPGCKQLLKLAGCYRGSVGLFLTRCGPFCSVVHVERGGSVQFRVFGRLQR